MDITRNIGKISRDLSCVTDVLGESAWKGKTIRTTGACVARHVDQLKTGAGSTDVRLVNKGRIANKRGDYALVIDTARRGRHVVNAEIANRSAQHWIHAGCRSEQEAPTTKCERGTVGDDAPNDLAENILTVCNRKERIERIDCREG